MSSTSPTAPHSAAPASLRAGLRAPVGLVRWLGQTYLTPGRPGRPTTQTELRWIYTAWLGAFALKMLGSSWDVSWHFRWLRDDLAPPHLLNSAGTALAVALVVFHSYSGHGVDRRALRLMQWGIGTFLVAIPLDLINHRVNGLDITSWSPSHALLYLGTAIMLAGALRGWWLYAAPGRLRDLISLGLWLFFVENVLFANQHQEYGVLSLADYRAGHTTAEPSLLDFAAAHGQSPEQFMLPVPSWVHPAWLVCAGVLTLVVARRAVGLRWTATLLAGAYLGYRAVAWVLLTTAGFPPSVLPVMLLAGAVGVDLAVTHRVPGWLAAVPVTAAVVLAAVVQDAVAVIPPWRWAATPLVALGLVLLWTGVDRLVYSAAFVRWQAADEPGAVPSAPAAPLATNGGAPAR
ncbi:hypothetical protein SAMN05661080_04665 [Modestobacter sp. DSM 44400]|uniref:hypothetical protein n=1 Tax=Modestobacter sp. DSM 44400 TaxID=1550230 RepID=UPI0008968B74|nr:hypothetical protein [Modestobacter sp. DSM 44400]SDY80643.1 hypothetical protein SAMN05661080_04665 [Modestobacter sp. DSM 44400]